MNFKKLLNSFENKKRIRSLIIYRTIFLNLFLNNFLALLLFKTNAVEIFDVGDVKKKFISRSTEILIELNFWLGLYVT